jgi:hypothetical protein
VDGCKNQAQLLILKILLRGFYELEYCRLCDIMTNPDVNICHLLFFLKKFILRDTSVGEWWYTSMVVRKPFFRRLDGRENRAQLLMLEILPC